MSHNRHPRAPADAPATDAAPLAGPAAPRSATPSAWATTTPHPSTHPLPGPRRPSSGHTSPRPAPEGEPTPAPDLPAVLTADELAALLRVDRKTVYNLITRGDIPGVRRLGKTIRISRDAVLRWLSEGQSRVSRSRGAR
ncbi:helix-turn-helix domain-containing protein [Polyangium sp. 15x6]|uniref:helix-turn-helix domain-containing protein n=1 Tax=Polyangium sp. 15x6 TaxID=3042687 RepID=UPI0032B5DCA0